MTDKTVDESEVFLILPVEIMTMTVFFPLGSYLLKKLDGRL